MTILDPSWLQGDSIETRSETCQAHISWQTASSSLSSSPLCNGVCTLGCEHQTELQAPSSRLPRPLLHGVEGGSPGPRNARLASAHFALKPCHGCPWIPWPGKDSQGGLRPLCRSRCSLRRRRCHLPRKAGTAGGTLLQSGAMCMS